MPPGARRMMGVLAALALAAAAGRAQTVDNWTSTSSSTWGAAGNWSVGIPSSADAATFNNTSGLESAVTLLAASSTGTLVFLSTGGATAYTFDTSGTENTNTLTIASGITNADTAALTFYNTTTLGGSQSWENDGGTMTFDGNVNLGSGANGFTLTVSGAGAVNIAGVIANGGTTAGSLTYGGIGHADADRGQHLHGRHHDQQRGHPAARKRHDQRHDSRHERDHRQWHAGL
jgi:fibronectin-binding autotransporter adhesin